MEVGMPRYTSRTPEVSGLEILGGCILLLFKVALAMAVFWGTLALLGNITGQELHTFGIDTGFWTQLGLVFLPVSVISIGVGSALGAASVRK
jgi:hypothetical protein